MNESGTPRCVFSVWRWTWFIIAPLMLISYVLSIGPTEWLLVRGYYPAGFEDVLIVAYLPLEFAADQSDSAKKLLWWYIGLWIGDE